jgi:tryptophan synthase beta subunit
METDALLLINLSGRGDKDVISVEKILGAMAQQAEAR